MASKEKWMVKNRKEDFQTIARQHGISEITARLLVNRGLTQDQEIEAFLHPKLSGMHDPGQMKDLNKTRDILMEKIRQKQKIRIVGDYDVDGVVSTFVLWKALCVCGAQVDYQIPDRIKDGYGINLAIVQKAFEDGIDTILTCDNGISAVEQTAYAKEHKMTVLITDHHELPEQLPKADTIVNPKQKEDSYPYSGLCGAGVAYKLVEALYKAYGIEGAEEYLELVAIATVCDVMELTGENRIIVSYGLQLLRESKYPGLRALMEVNSVYPERLSTYHLGYILGPCLNASGRLDTAVRGVKLLACEEREEAFRLAAELKQLNDVRKDMTAKGVEQAILFAEAKERKSDKVLLLYLPECHESLAGIIAGRLRERYHQPVIVLTKGENCVKGSGRSIEGYSMFEELVKCKEHLLKFGGHPMAAGLSLEEEKIEAFREALNRECSLTEEDFTVKVSIDIVLAFCGITKEGIEELNLLEPFGKGNEKPVFADRGVQIIRLSLVGKSTQYIKLVLKDRFGCQMDAMYFGDSGQFLEELTKHYGEEEVRRLYQGRGDQAMLSIVYYPGINEYQGRETLQITIQHYQME